MACCIVAAIIIHRTISTLEYFNTQYHTGNRLKGEKSGPDEQKVIHVGDEEVVAQHLSLSDLTCESCCTSIEATVRQLPGVVKITTSLLLSSATVVYKRKVIRLERIRAAIRDAGYGTSIQQNDTELLEVLSRKRELEQLRVAFQGSAVLSAISWCSNYAIHLSQGVLDPGSAHFLYFVFSLIPAWVVQIWFGRSIHIGAWWHGDKTKMDTLLSTSILLGLEASIADVIFGTANPIYPSASRDFILHTNNALLVTVVMGGRYLNQALRAKATSRISALHTLRSATSHVILLPQRKSQPVLLLQTNDRILIPEDSVIPCDCYVTDGTSSVDQALLTGEAAYQTKRPGDLLMSGTTNMTSPLEAVVTHPPEKSSLSRLVEAVRASSASSDDITADMFPVFRTVTNYFAQAVMIIAAVAFFAAGFSSLRAHSDWVLAWNMATRRAMLILSVACPCSLGLATPAATMAGINAALRRGVLVRGGLGTLGKLATLTHAAFDKTGTLTRAGLEVSGGNFVHGIGHQNVYEMLCAVEKDEHATHIVGRAVFRWAYGQLDESRKKRFQSIATKDLIMVQGKGVIGKVSLTSGKDWIEVVVGSCRLLQERGILMESAELPAQSMSNQLVYISLDGAYSGYLILEDVVRSEAPEALSRLHSLGLDTYLITGDNKAEAERVADIVGISRDHVTSGALPWDKECKIREIQRRGGAVAMIGDGLNDLAAQSAADVSVGVCAGKSGGGLGLSLAASSSSEVTLLPGTDLHGLYEVIHIARRTVRQARINLGWALAYNTVALVAAAGFLEPIGISLDVSMTGMIMAISSVSVLLLSQRVS